MPDNIVEFADAMLICSVSICPVHLSVSSVSMAHMYCMLCTYVCSDSALVACACVVDIYSIYCLLLCLLLCVVLYVCYWCVHAV